MTQKLAGENVGARVTLIANTAIMGKATLGKKTHDSSTQGFGDIDGHSRPGWV